MWRRCFSQAWVQWTLAVPAAVVGTTVPAAFAYAVEPSTESTLPPPDLPPVPSAWEHLFTIKAGLGYKDNLTLAAEPIEASPFVGTALEAFVLRQWDSGDQLMGLATFEDSRFWAGKTVDHEDLGIAQGEWRRFWANDWQAALAMEGIYIDQVVDLSITETNREALPVRGWTLTARPSVRRELSERTWLVLEMPVSRQMYDGSSLDDYWDAGPRFVVGHALGSRIETSLVYAFTHRGYDNEPGRNAIGQVDTNTVRAAAQHDIAGAWKQYWGQERRWRSVTKLGYRHSSDNLSGYFDYERYSISQEIRFQTVVWEFSAEARFAHYRYPVQPVSYPDDLRKRERADLNLAVRGERQIAKHVRLYAQYDYERTDSNAALDEYTVNTVSGGVAVEF